MFSSSLFWFFFCSRIANCHDIRVVIVTTFAVEQAIWIDEIEWDIHYDSANIAGNDCVDHQHRIYSPMNMLLICTGMGKIKATAAIVEIGYRPDFDVTDAFWVVSGIAGGDPDMATIGSVNVVEHIIEYDHMYYINALEDTFPKQKWTTGWIAFERSQPFELPKPTGKDIVKRINPKLIESISFLLNNSQLVDLPMEHSYRKAFNDTRKATVFLGDNLAGDHYWLGPLETRNAREMTTYLGGKQFATSSMEDFGIASALKMLENLKKIDSSDRLIVLRGVSDFVYRPLNFPVDQWIMGPGWINLNRDLPSIVATQNLFLTGFRIASFIHKQKK